MLGRELPLDVGQYGVHPGLVGEVAFVCPESVEHHASFLVVVDADKLGGGCGAIVTSLDREMAYDQEHPAVVLPGREAILEILDVFVEIVPERIVPGRIQYHHPVISGLGRVDPVAAAPAHQRENRGESKDYPDSEPFHDRDKVRHFFLFCADGVQESSLATTKSPCGYRSPW